MICGSCGMRMDGAAVLACQERMYDIAQAGHVPVISAMGNLPIVKDLVVDMDPFWEKFRSVDPFLRPGYDEPPRRQGEPDPPGADERDPQGVALHQLRLLRLRVQRDGVRPAVHRPAGACEGDALRRRPARRPQGRASRGAERRARHLGVHALLFLQRAVPEGRRSARRDRQARRRVDEGGHRPRHGREAREVVRRLREDDGLAAGDRARAEDAGHRRGDQADALRARSRGQGQGPAAVPAARGEERQRGAPPARSRSRPGRERIRRHRAGRARAREARARARLGRDARADLRTARRVPAAVHRRRGGQRRRHEAGRVLQGLSRVAVGEGARLGHAGARAEGRPRARGARIGDVLRRRRHPRGRARLLPPPERAHPRVRSGRRRRHAA